MGKIPTYIIGTGGLGRGVMETVKFKVRQEANWEIAGFIDDNKDVKGTIINGVEVIGATDELKNLSAFSNIIIAVASPIAKEKIYNKLKDNQNLFFPNVIHPSVSINETVKLGEGNVISENVVFSANVEVGSFNLIHFNSTIGHDVNINNFTSIYPGCNISGYAILNDSVLVGTNTAILPNIVVEQNVIIGAGAVVNKDVIANSKVAGVPAKYLK